MGGRGSSGQKYQTYPYDRGGIKGFDLTAAFKHVASAPVGTRVTAHYVFGGDTTYEVQARHGGGAKKQLRVVNSPGTYNRGYALSSPSSAKKIIGNPLSVKVQIPTVRGKQSYNNP